LRTYRRIHLTGTAAAAGRFPRLPAIRTALGFIGIAFGRVKLLLVGAEDELFVAVSAGDIFVGETHVMTSKILTNGLKSGDLKRE
jgi:hypothetical protein